MRLIVTLILSFTMFTTLCFAKLIDPLTQDPDLIRAINSTPEKTFMIHKNDKLTYFYQIYKTSDYVTVNKIFQENNNIKLNVFEEGRLGSFTQFIFIYDKKLNLLHSYTINDFFQLMEYINKSIVLGQIYKLMYITIDNTDYVIKVDTITVLGNETKQFKIYAVPKKNTDLIFITDLITDK